MAAPTLTERTQKFLSLFSKETWITSAKCKELWPDADGVPMRTRLVQQGYLERAKNLEGGGFVFRRSDREPKKGRASRNELEVISDVFAGLCKTPGSKVRRAELTAACCNSLQHLTKDQIAQRVSSFVIHSDLVEVDTFTKGGILVRIR